MILAAFSLNTCLFIGSTEQRIYHSNLVFCTLNVRYKNAVYESAFHVDTLTLVISFVNEIVETAA